MSAVKVSATTATELRHYRPENNGQIVQLANWPFSARESFGTFFGLRSEMSRDSQGNPSQPSYVYVMWLLLTCCQSSCVKIV